MTSHIRVHRILVALLAAALPAGAQAAAQVHEAAPVARDGERKPPRPGAGFPNSELYYPADAKRDGVQGAAVIHFCVDRVGNLTEPPTIDSSSGSDQLDAAAVNVATAGSGHYTPALEKGVAVAGCGRFRVAFELSVDTIPTLSDARYPTVSARLRELEAEYTRRMKDLVGKFQPPSQPPDLVPGNPDSVRVIREYARTLDANLDDSVAMTAGFFEDVDYLARSPDIPESERKAFVAAWPEQRAALALRFRQMIGAARDIVRLMDELADYVGFGAPPRPDGAVAGVAGSQAPTQDPQLRAILERARLAMDHLRVTIAALGETTEKHP
jgi:TonB family protein